MAIDLAATPRASSVRDPRSVGRLVLLVTAGVFINYIDRGNLATAAPLMQDELHLWLVPGAER